ncbi:oxidoreductase [Streptomyces sp. 150FB]|uniref:SDR family oxidoreductase n=1 Tax=Streptomyces sp. 150FB TaxID=1576605 RepID=UPI0005891400|nr:SDR family oxidoreductase [Streptomyces sp. 150FB]KIF78192.1 oxidoreductase [Streptomyces sp. 150FB]
MSSTIVVTGASSGFGALTSRALADAGHTVYAGMRGTTGHNTKAVAEAEEYAREHAVELRTVELDISDQQSVDTGIGEVMDRTGRIDVVIHNAGHMVLGPAESFTPYQLAQVYDTNVLSAQRVNRAVLPQMRARHDGLLVWVASSSTFGGSPPYLGPYFGAKAAMDHLAKTYAVELSRFGIDSSIVVPGSFTSGTNHFAHAMQPDDEETAKAYEEFYSGMMEQVGERLAALAPADADVGEVARTIVDVVDSPKGSRPSRITVDPADDGSETVTDLADRVRADFYERIGLADLLSTRVAP